MGHGDPLDDPNLKGISRYFNSSTIRGRANVAKATIVSMIIAWQYYKHKRKDEGPIKTSFQHAEFLINDKENPSLTTDELISSTPMEMSDVNLDDSEALIIPQTFN